MERRERRLAAIMLTDIVGFSKKMGANEEAQKMVLRARQLTEQDAGRPH